MRALALFLLVWATPALAQLLIVNRSSYVREAANGDAQDCYHAQEGDTLVLDGTDFHNGYYRVRAPGNCNGYVYRNRVTRRDVSHLPVWAVDITPDDNGGGGPVSGDGRLSVCSFNIKWLGHYTRKRHEDLASMVAGYDMVVVQELMAPPVQVPLANRMVAADEHSAQFFQFMAANGFVHAMSVSGTGQTEPPASSTSQEWPVVFYRDDEVRYIDDQSHFVSTPAAPNGTFDRVPFAFHFATHDGSFDFTFINSHLTQGPSGASVQDRRNELLAISQWCTANTTATGERDHIILGDMNIYSATEMANALPEGFVSLNSGSAPTTMSESGGGGRPFDQVLYQPAHTANDLVLGNGQFTVLNLLQMATDLWDQPGGPPDPVDERTEFEQLYSDHKPIVFTMRYGGMDDD